ncbi:MAG: 50S ribosomal protein L32 [uncultured bacterium]|nr:MAG: 50S ribosomal protein L32 [uncultured bacterium]HLD44832.1 50S ribosomal protein L32 [bacterium]
MAVPKRRTSKSKKGMRRSHHHLRALDVSVCPNCQNAKLPHRVCPHCGYYKSKEILTLDKE